MEYDRDLNACINIANRVMSSMEWGNFYEVKCPSDRRGRHKGECLITITEDEQKFGELFSNRFTIIILFNGVKYNIPFSDLKERIMRNRVDRTPLGGTPRVRRQVTLGKSFLKKYESLYRVWAFSAVW